MLIRVLEIPPSSGDFHFGVGEKQTFVQVDWFRDEACPMQGQEGQDRIAEFIKGKQYFNKSKAYLVLAQENTFTINYLAP